MDNKVKLMLIGCVVVTILGLIVYSLSGKHANTGNIDCDKNNNNNNLGSFIKLGITMNVEDNFLESENKEYTARFINNYLTVNKSKDPNYVSVTKIGSVGPAAFLLVQADGNLVLYNQDDKAVWFDRKGGTNASNWLQLEDNGKVCLYSGASSTVQQSYN